MKKIVPDPPTNSPALPGAAPSSPNSATPPVTTLGLETFHEVGHPPVDLFRVLPGIPADHALDEVTNLLGCIRHLLSEGLLEQDTRQLAAADYLSAFAKAIMADLQRARLS